MRRMVQASLCVTLLWFGVMQLDGGLALQSKAAGAAGNVSDIRTVTYQYEAKTLLAKPGGKPGQAFEPNDREANDGGDGTGEMKDGGGGASNSDGGSLTTAATSAGGGKVTGTETDDSVEQSGIAGAENSSGGNVTTDGSSAGNGGMGLAGAGRDTDATGGSNNAQSGGSSVEDGAKASEGEGADAAGGAKASEGKGTDAAGTGSSAAGGTKAADGTQGGKAKAESGTEANAPAGGQAGKPSGKVIYLTFDDGPSQHTPEVLRILKQEGVPATFFLLGQQVERQPDLVKQIVSEGHAIGNHTYNHVYKELYGSFRNFADQIMRTDDAIYQASGIRTTLVRAPGGTYSNFDRGYFDALAAAGYQVHDWNVDSGDSKRVGVPASEIIANVHGSKIANTLNVLMHDSAGHAETVKALPAIIAYYKKLGYTFATLNEKVEPMQFKLASKTKWSRGAVSESDKASLVAFASKLDRAGGAMIQPEPMLVIHRGDQSLALQPFEYKLQNGSIRVPLDKLSEWLGGTAELDEKEGVVAVTFEGRQWFWLMDSWPPEPGEEAKLDVPIRATLAQFGMEIENYVYTKEQREVWIGA